MVVIGYGTYGCIYRPPIKCSKKTRKINYENKISKLLTEKSATTEQFEYNKISKIDKQHKYHLGKPILCKADEADLMQKTRKHKCKKYEDEHENKRFRLLIMEYGGMDLKTYIDDKKNLSMDFWTNARNLFDGVQLFAKHNLTHRDIKPANILLKPKTNQLVYIDFGLTDDMTKFKQKILDGVKTTKFHWTYPFEYGFASSAYPTASSAHPFDKKFADKLCKKIFTNKSSDEYKHVEKMFDMMDDRLSPLNRATKTAMIHESVESARKFDSADKFLESMIKSIDTFSLGLTMNTTLNAFYDAHKIDDSFYREMHALFAKMTNLNMIERLSDLKTIITLYDKVINKIPV
jgi:serine/threonine protein kinase